jgi:hypothetical protein
MGNFARGAKSVANTAQSITPADSDLATPVEALWVGGSGNIKITTLDGSVVTLVGAIAGSLIPIAVKRVWSTDTTATSIVGLS